MKKRLLSLLLTFGCLSASLSPALAVDATAEVTDPNLVLPYSEAEDPLAAGNHTRHSNADSSDRNTFEKVFGAAKNSRYSNFTNLTYSIPSGYNVFDGIDVSKWEDTINWNLVKNDGVDFALIRVGYRGTNGGELYEDPKYDSHMQGAASVNIPVGVYVFSQALTTAEAVAEANFALERVAGYNVQLPIIMDYEFYNGTGRLDKANLSKTQKTQNVLAFCDTVRTAGYQPMLYANRSFLTDELYDEQVSAVAPIWLANYTTNTSYTGSYDYWQYSESGSVSGINTDVDCNFYFTNGSLTPDDSVCGFRDVSASQWYADAVSFVYTHNLMNGTSASTFGPEESLSRCMMAQILYSFCGKPVVSYSKKFSDVPAGAWYTNAVMWASQNGVMSGYDDGTFGINDAISREQMAAVLYSFSNKKNVDTSARSDLSVYRDAGSISSYAVKPMQWAVANKLLSGRTPTTLVPQGTTSRAECAQILKGYFTGVAASLLES